MKRKLAYGILGLFALSTSAFSAQPGGPIVEHVQMPEKVFSPVGFDNNDNSQVVLFGHFPHNCYKAGPATYTVVGNEILVKNTSTENTAIDPCIKAPVPWTTTLNLGMLAPGKYSVKIADDTGKWVPYTDLSVSTALTERTDDYNYSYVEGAIIDRSGGTPVLAITGTFSLTCMQLGAVEVRESAGVIAVLPTVQIWESSTCGYPFLPIPYTKRVQLPSYLKGPTLIHIRSMNGQALNQVVEF